MRHFRQFLADVRLRKQLHRPAGPTAQNTNLGETDLRLAKKITTTNVERRAKTCRAKPGDLTLQFAVRATHSKGLPREQL